MTIQSCYSPQHNNTLKARLSPALKVQFAVLCLFSVCANPECLAEESHFVTTLRRKCQLFNTALWFVALNRQASLPPKIAFTLWDFNAFLAAKRRNWDINFINTQIAKCLSTTWRSLRICTRNMWLDYFWFGQELVGFRVWNKAWMIKSLPWKTKTDESRSVMKENMNLICNYIFKIYLLWENKDFKLSKSAKRIIN